MAYVWKSTMCQNGLTLIYINYKPRFTRINELIELIELIVLN